MVRTALFLIGTTIGAGFLTGAELIRFFGGNGYLPALALACAVYCLACAFFLSLGKKYGGFAQAMRALFGRGAHVAACLTLAVSFVPCAGMLAGLDALFPGLGPLPSVAGLAVVLLFLGRGMKGVGLLNCILVPGLLLFVAASAKGGVSLVVPSVPEASNGLLYAAMNTAFAAPALMDAGRDVRAPVRSAILAGGAIFVSGAFVLAGIFLAGADAVRSPMPYLYVMRGNRLFFVAAACAVLTSLASALFPLLRACGRFAGAKKNAAKGVVLLAAFVLSRLGLSGVIDLLYPAVGVFGAVFSALCIFDEYFFKQHDQRIHSRRQQAEEKGRAHHKIKFEHLPAVHDEVAESRTGNDIFSHDRTDPRHPHVDLQHGDHGGVG